MAVFLDTNVLVYRQDTRDKAKQQAALEQVDAIPERPWISTQVLIELQDTLVRTFGYSRPDAQDVIESNPYRVQPADSGLVYAAVATATRHQLRIYDAMILEAAVAAGCDEIWSEDFNPGHSLRGVRFVNPFTGPGA